ncbi:hypothetical protein CO610_11070 [Lysobacteraceae bacterium NML95-0200]|nr:hypothetical protein CO610_11070 [Xanthomonadaceae bacterium NML95-0200]
MSKLKRLTETSPAFKRYWRRSLPLMLLALPLGATIGYLSAPSMGEHSLWLRLPVLAMMAALLLWSLLDYLRFLRECDEFERKLEHIALLWSSGLVMSCAVLLWTAQAIRLAPLSAAHVLEVLILGFIASWLLIRLFLHWRNL